MGMTTVINPPSARSQSVGAGASDGEQLRITASEQRLGCRKRSSKEESSRPVPRLGALTSAGALGGTRTPNLLIRSQMLYPLSYECWALARLITLAHGRRNTQMQPPPMPTTRRGQVIREHHRPQPRPPVRGPITRTHRHEGNSPNLQSRRFGLFPCPDALRHHTAEVAGFEPAMGLSPKPA